MGAENRLQSIDVTAPSLEEAINQGLERLGLSRNDVIIEIVEEGSKGMLGLGARDAVVRLTPLRSSARQAAAPASTPAPAQAQANRPEWQPGAAGDLADEAQVGQDIVLNLLERMGVQVTITPTPGTEQDGEEPTLILDIRGRDLGMLIGRRGETLDALQYLTRMIANHRMQRRANIILDVEGYKSRRAEALHKLAQRMAEQARKMGRTVTLEPMPANERRIIHVALQNDSSVRTESIGDGEHRKVTIVPVSPASR